MTAVRHLDLLALAISLPVFLVASLPMDGWGVAAAAWLAQRGVQAYATRRARAADDPRTTVGLLAGSMIARGWLVAIAIFLVGLGHSRAGLAAAVLVVALFTVYFTVNIIMRPVGLAAGPSAAGPSAGAPAAGPAPLAPNRGTR